MHIQTTTPPAVEPVTVEQMRDHLAITGTHHDAKLAGFIAAARARAQRMLARRLITQTVTVTVDQFGDPWFCRDAMPLHIGPVQSVTGVRYKTAGDTWTTLPATDYRLVMTREPVELAPSYGRAWPVVLDDPGAVEITLVVGYGDAAADVPEDIREAVLMLAGHFFEMREATVVGTAATEIPMGVADLLSSHKLWV